MVREDRIAAGAFLLALALVSGCRAALPPQSAIINPQSAIADAPRPTYLVVRVIDGDTLEIADAGGIRTRVRLRRVNAPELSQPGGPEAKAALEARLLGRRVRVTPYARDRYGRLIAEVALIPTP